MKRWPVVILPLLWLFLCACPYVSRVPIAAPAQQADKMVFGDWVNADSSKGEEYTISEHEEGVWKYRIDGPEAMYDGWITAVDKSWFLNICNPAQMSDGIMILRVDKMNYNSIELTPISARNKEQFETSPQLMEWIKKHMNSPAFYDQGEKVKLIRS